ncbi:hypothetical protein CEE37_01150 [candidate division LCP-89 bacterium B3_LCP]|uniref:Deoxynucleoside kinase domain-containing protein n=1 Tax=candidate division LCP-89 bacterium B3_LCP TaxID=2012998 RepID=A0A532V536_UNCL8|nr:MAG: hypothetical protein CEE37_01150 [candidate division LCP-89 bacterium B3_LCP]
MRDTFDNIILIGRPAAGKSEVIDFLKKTQLDERRERFHIAEFHEIDDFPMIWTWFEEDAILEKIMDKPRKSTDKDGYFLNEYQWHLLIERISLDYSKFVRDFEDEDTRPTAILEFARGSEHGGFKAAFEHLSEDILKTAVILYINVPYEISLFRNRRRFNPDRPDSILEHGLPDEKLEKMYKESDWEEITAAHPEYIEIKGCKVPYAIFQNDPEKTDDPAKIAPHLEEITRRLWQLKQNA